MVLIGGEANGFAQITQHNRDEVVLTEKIAKFNVCASRILYLDGLVFAAARVSPHSWRMCARYNYPGARDFHPLVQRRDRRHLCSPSKIIHSELCQRH